MIASDFRIHKYKNGEERIKLQLTISEYTKQQSLKVFKVIPRKFNRFDEQYWTKQYGITQEQLRAAKIIPIQEYYLLGFDGYFIKRYSYFSSNPGYAYYGGEENGIKLWRLYFPLVKDKRRKFVVNKAFVQGKHLLRPAQVGLVAKSYKDALCYKSFGIQSLGLASETIILPREDYNDIHPLFDIMASNMDYDRQGIRMANKLKNQYNISPIMFTRGRFHQPDYGVKDFSDFIVAYGRNKAEYLIHNMLDKYQEELEYFNKYNYNSLKWLTQTI